MPTLCICLPCCAFGLQIGMHVLTAGCSLLAMLCWVYPSRIDSEVGLDLQPHASCM
jgi:hypothetical protein